MKRRIALALLGALLVGPLFADDAVSSRPEFFAFDNGVGRGSWTPEQQASLLAKLGYDGIGYTGTQNIPAMLQTLESRGLKMYSTYIKLDLANETTPYELDLPKAIQQLKGHGTAIWLHVHGGKASSDDLDGRAVSVLRELAGMAADANIPIVLYPHTGFYVATMTDAVRLVKKVDRPNVGASFNLCHFLKVEDPSTMDQRLEEAAPYLKLVSINGADAGDTNAMGWDRLIQTLDKGTFDNAALLKKLRQIGYKGPIGQQCYAIGGDISDNLKRSIEAWKKLNSAK